MHVLDPTFRNSNLVTSSGVIVVKMGSKFIPSGTDDNKGLLTECEVCAGKYLPEIFVQTERRRSDVCAKKTEGTIPYRSSKRG